MATEERKGYTALICDDCGVEIFADVNMIMVNDKLWKTMLKMAPKELNFEDALCDSCMEKRIGRPLTRDDWKKTNGQYPPCNLMTEAHKSGDVKQEEKKEDPENKAIKLRVEGESFWAHQLSEDTAEVANVTFSNGIGYKDIVRFDKNTHKVLEVLEKKTETMAIEYPLSGNTQEVYKTCFYHLESKGLFMEGMQPGVALIAIPTTMTDEELTEAIESCPISIKLMEDEEDV